MHELVIVLPDLYAAPDSPRAHALAWAARFGSRRPLQAGWRAWLTDWASGGSVRLAEPEQAGRSFLARPMHLIAGLTRVHAELRSILELSDAELERLAADHPRDFSGDTHTLRAAGGGELLLEGLACAATSTTEPARAVAQGIGASLPQGPGARRLRALQSELEMWLHAHPLNQDRLRRGLAPATALWLWRAPEFAGRIGEGLEPPLFFCGDAWLRSLARYIGANLRDSLPQAETLLSYPADRAVLAAPLVPLLQQDPALSVSDALDQIDRAWLAPALAAVRQGRLRQLHILVSDRHIELARAARLRFWRRGLDLTELLG